MYGRKTVAVVVPAFNEERLIGRTVSELPRYVDHVFVVDDGSRDGTSAVARAEGGERTRVIRHTRNRGVGAAIATGYRAALAAGADIAVVVGGDAQMDPSEMDRLIEPIAAGTADYVKGNRLGHREVSQRMPRARQLANRVLTELTRVAVGQPVNDSQCGYAAISRRALERLPLERLWPRYGYPNDLLGLLAARGLRTADRPVSPIYGDEVSGINPVTIGPTLAYVLARTWIRRRLSPRV